MPETYPWADRSNAANTARFYKFKDTKPITYGDESFAHLTPQKRTELWESGLRPPHESWQALYPDNMNLGEGIPVDTMRRSQFINHGYTEQVSNSGNHRPRSEWTEEQQQLELEASSPRTEPLPWVRKDYNNGEKLQGTIEWVRDRAEKDQEFKVEMRSEDALKGFVQRLPLGFGIPEFMEAYDSSKAIDRIYEDKATSVDYFKFARDIVLEEMKEKDPRLVKVLRGASQMPAFLADMYLTGGISAGAKTFGAKGLGILAKELGEAKFKSLMANMAFRSAKKILPKVAEAGVYASLVDVGSTAAEAIPQRDIRYDVDQETGKIKGFKETEKEHLANSLLRSVTNKMIEYGVEKWTGSTLVGTYKGAKNLLRPASQGGASVSRGGATVFEGTPWGAADDKWLVEVQKSTFYKINPNTGKRSAIGWDGILGEIGEERVTEVLQAANEAVFGRLPGAREGGDQRAWDRMGITGIGAELAGHVTGVSEMSPEQLSSRLDDLATSAATEFVSFGGIHAATKGGLGSQAAAAATGRLYEDPERPDKRGKTYNYFKDPILATTGDSKGSQDFNRDVQALLESGSTSRKNFEAVKLPDGSTLLDHFPKQSQREGYLKDIDRLNRAKHEQAQAVYDEKARKWTGARKAEEAEREAGEEAEAERARFDAERAGLDEEAARQRREETDRPLAIFEDDIQSAEQELIDAQLAVKDMGNLTESEKRNISEAEANLKDIMQMEYRAQRQREHDRGRGPEPVLGSPEAGQVHYDDYQEWLNTEYKLARKERQKKRDPLLQYDRYEPTDPRFTPTQDPVFETDVPASEQLELQPEAPVEQPAPPVEAQQKTPVYTTPMPTSAGESIVLFDSNGNEFEAEVIAISDTGAVKWRSKEGVGVLGRTEGVVGSNGVADIGEGHRRNTEDPNYKLNSFKDAVVSELSDSELPEYIDRVSNILEHHQGAKRQQGAVSLEADLKALENEAARRKQEQPQPAPVAEQHHPDIPKHEVPLREERQIPDHVVDLEQEEKDRKSVLGFSRVDLMLRFPGMKVEESEGGDYLIHLKNGRIRVIGEEKIAVTDSDLVVRYNDRVGVTQYKKNKSGRWLSFKEVFPTVESYIEEHRAGRGDLGTIEGPREGELEDEATFDVLATIRLANSDWHRASGQQLSTLQHEMVHYSHIGGLWSNAEWDALVKKYAPDPPGVKLSVRQQSEAIAIASKDWATPGIVEKITNWINRTLHHVSKGEHKLKPESVQALLFAKKGFWDRSSKTFDVKAMTAREGEAAAMGMAEREGEAAAMGMAERGDGDKYFAPEALQNAKDNSDASKSRSKLVWMSPDDFLGTAQQGINKEKTEGIKQFMSDQGRFEDIPYLLIKFETNENGDLTGKASAYGHEGRHRMRALKELGVQKVPVVIQASMFRWGEQDNPDNFDYVSGVWPTTLEDETGSASIPFPVTDIRPQAGPQAMGMAEGDAPPRRTPRQQRGDVFGEPRGRAANPWDVEKNPEEWQEFEDTLTSIQDANDRNAESRSVQAMLNDLSQRRKSPQADETFLNDLRSKFDNDPDYATSVWENEWLRQIMHEWRTGGDLALVERVIQDVSKMYAKGRSNAGLTLGWGLSRDASAETSEPRRRLNVIQKIMDGDPDETNESRHGKSKEVKEAEQAARDDFHLENAGTETGTQAVGGPWVAGTGTDAKPGKGKPRRLKDRVSAPKDSLVWEMGDKVRKAYNAEKARLKRMKDLVESVGYTFDLKGLRELAKDADAFDKLLPKLIKSWSVFAMYTEYHKGAMLSGPSTGVINFVSPLAWSVYRQGLESPLAAVINSLYAKIAGIDAKDIKGLMLSDYRGVKGKMVAGWFKGAALGFRYGFNSVLNLALDKQRATIQSDTGFRSKDGKSKFKKDWTPGKAIKGRFGLTALGALVRVVGYGPIAATDQFMSSVISHTIVAAYAQRIARHEGLQEDTPNYDQRVEELIIDKTSDAWQAAMGEATEQLFQGEGKEGTIRSGVFKAIKTAKDIPVLGFALDNTILPFHRAMINLPAEGFVRIPIFGLLPVSVKMIKNIRNKKPLFENTANAEELAGQLWFLMLALFIASLVDGDEEKTTITGAMLDYDPQERRHRYTEGVAPPSSVKINNEWWSFDKADPIATPIAIFTDLFSAYKKGKSATEILSDVGFSATKQISGKTFGQGLRDLTRAASEEGGWRRWAVNFAGSHVPNIYQQERRVGLPFGVTSGQDYVGYNPSESWVEEVGKRTEILGTDPIYDVWGRKAKNITHWTGAKVASAQMFRGDRVFVNWNDNNPEEKAFPAQPSDEYTVNFKKRRFVGEDFGEYQRVAGTLARGLVIEMVSSNHSRNPDALTLKLTRSILSRSRYEVKEHWKKTGNFDINEARLERKIRIGARTEVLKTPDKPRLTGDPNQDIEAETQGWEDMKKAIKRYRSVLKKIKR